MDYFGAKGYKLVPFQFHFRGATNEGETEAVEDFLLMEREIFGEATRDRIELAHRLVTQVIVSM